MKLALRLLLITLLTLFAVSAGGAVPGASAQPTHAPTVDRAGMDMVECAACAPDRMSAGMNACGSICISAAVALPEVQILERYNVAGRLFALADFALAGRTRVPELTPPKQILS